MIIHKTIFKKPISVTNEDVLEQSYDMIDGKIRNSVHRLNGERVEAMSIIKGDDGEEYAEIDVMTVGRTELAVRFDDGDNEFWIPKSAMEDWPDMGESGTAMVARWFAEKEGLV